MEENEKKIVAAYTVLHYEDKSTDVVDAGVEGTTPMEREDIFRDIETVADTIKLKRVENAAFVGGYNGTAKFYDDVAKKNAENEGK